MNYDLTYNAENKVATSSSSILTITYTYDGTTTTTDRYIGAHFAIMDGTVRAECFGPPKHAACTLGRSPSGYMLAGKAVAVKNGATLEYLLSDHLGSASVSTNSAGTAILSEQRYYPYGEVRWSTGGDLPTDYTYTGQREDLGGLMDYRARYYDPALNRFIQADTIVPEPENSQAYNRYMFVVGNPLRYIDPTGHFTDDAIKNYLKYAYGDDWESIWNAWNEDDAWMDFLYEARAGDIGGFMYDDAIYWYEFGGVGRTVLSSVKYINGSVNEGSETDLNAAWNNGVSSCSHSWISGLLRPVGSGYTVIETDPGPIYELMAYTQVDTQAERYSSIALRTYVMLKMGKAAGVVIGATAGKIGSGILKLVNPGISGHALVNLAVDAGSKLGPVITFMKEVAGDGLVSDAGTSMGDEAIILDITVGYPGAPMIAAPFKSGFSIYPVYWGFEYSSR